MRKKTLPISAVLNSLPSFETRIRYKTVDPSISAYRYEDNENAGVDMFLSKDTWIFPFFSRNLPLNIIIEIPPNYYGRITGRSGLSSKNHITIPGTIDSGYRGQPHCQMYRLGLLPKKMKKGTRICQLIIQPYVKANFIESENLSHSKRDKACFGSSGEE